MRMYGGNKKRIISKYAFHSFDGVYYSWNDGLFRIKLMISLKPGDIFFIPYTKEWGEITKVDVIKYYLNNYTGHPLGSEFDDKDERNSRKIKGWWIGEVVVHVKSPSKDTTYCVYDIEHWNAFAKSNKRRDTENEELDYRLDQVPHDLEMVKKFNQQVGLPIDYDLPEGWRRWY